MCSGPGIGSLLSLLFATAAPTGTDLGFAALPTQYVIRSDWL